MADPYRQSGEEIIRSVATIFLMVATLVLFNCCTQKEKNLEAAVTDRKTTPRLIADSITTVVSDSGIVRYRITAPRWSVYEWADTPYWDFPLGVRFERFDEQYDIDAEIECRRAIYYTDLELWKLNDSVRATNLSGEHFETEELYWDQQNERVYSDSLITIIQRDKKIIGVGFESNQTFSRYTINRPTGILPVDNE